MSEEEFVKRLGSIHETVHGNGRDVLSRITNTCVEMLSDRKYQGISVAQDPLDAVITCKPIITASSPRALHIYMCGDDRIGVKFIRSLEAADKVQLILVSTEGPTSFAKKECNPKTTQFLLARQVVTNVTHHALVPKHTELQTLPPHLTPDRLPKMLESDAVAQYYNWKHGTLVRIERNFGGDEPSTFYRIVTLCTS